MEKITLRLVPELCDTLRLCVSILDCICVLCEDNGHRWRSQEDVSHHVDE